MMRAIINVNTYDYRDFNENRYIIFNENIVDMGDMLDFSDCGYEVDSVIDAGGKLLIPGFINAHTHIYSYFARGLNIEFNPKNFQDILNQLWWRIDKEIDKDILYHSAIMYGIESIKNGVTTLVDHNASGKSIKGSLGALESALCEHLKMRAVLCYETSDRFDVNSCIQENVQIGSKKSKMAGNMFGLHASMSLCDSTLKKVEESINLMPIHVHCGESVDDVEDSYKKYGCGVVERFDKFNLITDGSILAHCVNISEKELEILKDKDVYIVINVNSNMNNSVGLPRFKTFKEHNLKVVVGTDGLGSNISGEYVTVVNAMKNQLGNPCAFQLCDLVEMIENSSELVSRMLGSKIGKIRKGYVADFQLYEYHPSTPMNKENIMAHVFYGVYGNIKPTDVLIGGNPVLEKGMPIIDEKNAADTAQKYSLQLWENILRGDKNC